MVAMQLMMRIRVTASEQARKAKVEWPRTRTSTKFEEPPTNDGGRTSQNLPLFPSDSLGFFTNETVGDTIFTLDVTLGVVSASGESKWRHYRARLGDGCT